MTDSNGNQLPPTPPTPPVAPVYAQSAAPASVPGKTLGIVALIVAIFFNIIGLILGIVALVQSRRVGAKNGPAVAAIIVGAVLFILGIVIAIIAITAGAAAISSLCQGMPSGTSTLSNGVTVTCP
ncbi:DUF4190 domain-containing protein [Subtercola frigoramans]|uniref:Membrane protein n=1 Tax=Subtercola frigoramans TaxID=120298 RepID=A0ABS2L7H5_9MICO|nr:DUF4190 domain-containing protein [Subtercola frigoramans]MBM7473052.1 putative membrane protein [Subtercola frigoramans]